MTDQQNLEEIILGSILIDSDARIEFTNLIQTLDVFTVPENRKIAETVRALNDGHGKIDIVTVCEHLKKSGELKSIGGAKKIAGLTSKVSSAAHFDIHIRFLLENYLKRGVGRFAQQLIQTSISETTDAFESIAMVQVGLENLVNQAVSDVEKPFAETLNQRSKKWLNTDSPKLAGLSTGIHALDEAIGGLVDTDLIVIAARPGQGKTAFVLSILRNLVKQNIPVGMFSLEMPEEQLIDRLVSQESDVFNIKIRKNDLNHFDRERLGFAKVRMEPWPIYISDRAGITLRQLKTKAFRWKKKHGIQLLIVDYLQLMSGDSKKSNREGEISEISRGLKVLAKDLKIPVIALSQLSREVEKRPNKMPQLSDLRESGAIEQDADIVGFLMRPEHYKMTENIEFAGGISLPVENLCIFDIAKFRAGDTTTIPLKFYGPTMKFSDFNSHNNFAQNAF